MSKRSHIFGVALCRCFNVDNVFIIVFLLVMSLIKCLKDHKSPLSRVLIQKVTELPCDMVSYRFRSISSSLLPQTLSTWPFKFQIHMFEQLCFYCNLSLLWSCSIKLNLSIFSLISFSLGLLCHIITPRLSFLSSPFYSTTSINQPLSSFSINVKYYCHHHIHPLYGVF